MGKSNAFFIIDFDSVFVQVESLDELAKIALQGKPNRQKILSQIANLTKKGMEGKIPFSESLEKRLRLLKANKKHLKKLIKLLKSKITPSVKRNKEFFSQYSKYIYIVSGGFREFILPVVSDYGIKKDHILANSLIFDKKGNIVGYDKNNPLAQEQGKIKIVSKLALNKPIYIIGDGYTDYEVKAAGKADKFFALTENVYRKALADKADYVIPNFDEFLYLHNLPRAFSYPKHRIKVLVLENIDQKAIERFKQEGYSVTVHPAALEENELIERIENISILAIRSRTTISKKVLNKAKRLLTIGAFCIGTNQIDLKACTQKGIPVFNAPYSNTRSVVELVLGTIIMLLRQVGDRNMEMHQGRWFKTAKNSYEVRGKKLGIIGYGNIGSQLSILAEALGMRVYFYDPIDKLALGNAKKCDSLEELLKTADIISLHASGEAKNKHLIGKKEFSMMKTGVYFLNFSRGHLVDYNSLAEFIKKGKIKGAAIDVFPEEPKTNKENHFTSPLQGLPNVVLTPHLGGSTQEAQQRIGVFVANKIIDFINTGNTTLSVNFPNLLLPKQHNLHRLIHIHKNQPGILAQINSILSKYNINIEGQYLKTNEDIGYVITDVNKNYDNRIITELKAIKNTIRVRVLY